MTRPDAAPRALLVDPDPVLAELLDEWLGEQGWRVSREARGRYDLLLLDVPFPRDAAGVEAVRRAAREHPGAPILVLSSNFFAGVECCGPVARTLGVAGVLPKPVTRAALLAAVGAVRRATA